MSLMSRLFGRTAAPQPRREAAPTMIGGDANASRRELVAMAVNDTLRKHGIPNTWITAETSPAATQRKQRGLHLRLILREWQPELLEHSVALQKSLRTRIARLDPLSADWLTGMSWKLDLVDEAACPAMPDAAYWRALSTRQAARAEAAKKPAAPAAAPAADPTAAPAGGAQAALRRLLVAGDRAFTSPSGEQDFKPTQPMLARDLLLSKS